MHLHFMSFLHIDMTQVVEIFPQLKGPWVIIVSSVQNIGCVITGLVFIVKALCCPW